MNKQEQIRRAYEAFARWFYSWKLILGTTGISLMLLAPSIYFVWLRSYSIPLGFTAALLHMSLSTWLWRDYMYGEADFDSDDSYAPSGLTKSMYMLGSFIVLLLASLAVAIIDVEQGCLSLLQKELGVC